MAARGEGAVVKSEEIFIGGDVSAPNRGKGWWLKKTRFDAGLYLPGGIGMRFNIELPPTYLPHTGEVTKVYGKTIEEVEEKFDILKTKLKFISTTEAKMIWYHISLSGRFVTDDGVRHDLGQGCHPLGLNIEAIVVNERVSTGLNDEKTYTYKVVESSIPQRAWDNYSGGIHVGYANGNRVHIGNGEGLIDWTPEREAFFAGLILQFQGILVRVADFLKGDIAQQIDTSAGFFLGPGKECHVD